MGSWRQGKNVQLQLNIWPLLICSTDSFHDGLSPKININFITKYKWNALLVYIFISTKAAINVTIKRKIQRVIIVRFQYRTQLTNKNVAHRFYFLDSVIRCAVSCAIATGVDDIAHSAVVVVSNASWWTSKTKERIGCTAVILLIPNDSNSCPCQGVGVGVWTLQNIKSLSIAISLQRWTTDERLPFLTTKTGCTVLAICNQIVQRTCWVADGYKFKIVANFHSNTKLFKWSTPVCRKLGFLIIQSR